MIKHMKLQLWILMIFLFKKNPSFDIIKQLYRNQLSNKNEGQLSNESTDSILNLNKKTDNSSTITKIKKNNVTFPIN